MRRVGLRSLVVVERPVADRDEIVGPDHSSQRGFQFQARDAG